MPRLIAPPIIIDVEASGFGNGSYPIEVGVALADRRAESMIICPEADWVHWDPGAEKLHGISRDILLAHGRSVRDVVSSLNALIGGQTVYTDAWGSDCSWLALLYDRAGQHLSFKLEPLRSLLNEQQVVLWHTTKTAIEKELDLRRHRASTDAKILQATLLQVWAISPAGD